jgi:4-oxalocrotonate tautomerase
MPLVRIDLAHGKPPRYRPAIADVVYTAMTGVLNVPQGDRFMVITERDEADLVVSPEYLGIEHTTQVVLIQVTLTEGRTVR